MYGNITILLARRAREMADAFGHCRSLKPRRGGHAYQRQKRRCGTGDDTRTSRP